MDAKKVDENVDKLAAAIRQVAKERGFTPREQDETLKLLASLLSTEVYPKVVKR